MSHYCNCERCNECPDVCDYCGEDKVLGEYGLDKICEDCLVEEESAHGH